MDCLTAQGLISDALDRAPLDAAELTEAKEHCQGCASCSVFVRTLLLVRSTPTPAPPVDLVDRVMTTVRAEAAQARQASEQAAAENQTVPTDDATTVTGDSSAAATQRIPDALRDKRGTPLQAARTWMRGLSRQEAITWASAAVIFIAAVGIAATAGVRLLTTPPATDASLASEREMSAKYGAADAGQGAADSAASIAAPSVEAAGSYITVQSVVYVLSGPSTIATAGLAPAGTVTSALGSGMGPKSHTVFKADDPDRIYVLDTTSGQLLAFDRVVRTFSGNRYQLTSDALSDYGQWPNLPANISEPTSPDGSPTFTRLADDESGTPIYRLAGGNELAGIAVGPGSGQSDPAVGNPNWTWWTPAR